MDSKTWDLLGRHVKQGEYCSYCLDPNAGSGYDGAMCPWPCDTAELLTRFGYQTREIPLPPPPEPVVVDPSVHVVTMDARIQLGHLYLQPGDSIALRHDLGPDHDHASCDVAELLALAQIDREVYH